MPDAVTDDSRSSAVANPPAGNASATAAEPNANANGAPGGESDADRNWKNLRGDRDYWRDRATQLETSPPTRAAAPPANATPPANDQAPTKKTLADFNFDERAYDEHLRTAARDEARKAVREELSAEEQRKAAEARRTTFESRAAEFAKANPKYHEDVRNPRFVQSDALITEIMESEQGPAIAHYLANNIDETNRLNRMTPVQVAREVVKLEVKLASQATARNKVPAGDPPPNPPAKLDGTGDPGLKKDPAKMSDAEWWAARSKKK